MRLSILSLWEGSLLGRLIAIMLLAWEHSWIGRAFTASGRFLSRITHGSLGGRLFWSPDWLGGRHARLSVTAQIGSRAAGLSARIGRWAGPWLKQLWASSLFVAVSTKAVGLANRLGQSSVIYGAFAGYADDVQAAAFESNRRAVSPLVYPLGLLLGMLPLIPTDFVLFGFRFPSPTVLMIVGVWGLAAVWVAHKWVTGDENWRGSSAAIPLLFMLAVAFAATVQSANPRSSLLTLIIWLTAGLLFWMIVNLVRNSRAAAALLGPILAGVTLMTLWAVYQFFYPPEISERWFDPTTSGDITRVFASMGNPNYLAEYIALYLPLGVALWIQQPRRRLELAVPVGLMAIALVLTYSRGGWLALLVAMGLLMLMRAPRLSVLMVIGAILTPLVAPESVIRRIISAVSTADTSNLYRLNLWIGVKDMIAKYWVLGAGLGAEAFNNIYKELFMLPEAQAAHAHNIYLQIFAEIGIFGLIAVIWVLVTIVRRTWVVGVRPERPILIAAVAAALVGLLVHGLVEHIWYNPKLVFAFWAVAGLGMGLAQGDREDIAA